MIVEGNQSMVLLINTRRKPCSVKAHYLASYLDKAPTVEKKKLCCTSSCEIEEDFIFRGTIQYHTNAMST